MARIEKSVGRRGEVVAVPADGLPLLVSEGMEVWPVPPRLRGARSLVVSHRSDSGQGARLAFVGVDDLDGAACLVGRTLLACVDDLPEGYEMRDRRRVLGMRVCDRRLGDLGVVEEVLVGPVQDTWVVRGSEGEVLVPAVAEIVRIEGDVAYADLPDGLVGGEA